MWVLYPQSLFIKGKDQYYTQLDHFQCSCVLLLRIIGFTLCNTCTCACLCVLYLLFSKVLLVHVSSYLSWKVVISADLLFKTLLCLTNSKKKNMELIIMYISLLSLQKVNQLEEVIDQKNEKIELLRDQLDSLTASQKEGVEGAGDATTLKRQLLKMEQSMKVHRQEKDTHTHALILSICTSATVLRFPGALPSK